jgi:hypothetical protein
LSRYPRRVGPLDRLASAVSRLAELTKDRPATGTSHDDSDDTVGTVASDDARGFDPFPLLRACHEVGAPVVVIGQVAGILHGSVELTGDLDLLWSGHPDDVPAMVAAFASVSADLAGPDGGPMAVDAAAFGLPKVLFRTPGASGDCCTPALPWGDLPVADFLPRSLVAVGADGLRVRYLDRADLVTMRRAVGRPKDLRRAAELQRLDPV